MGAPDTIALSFGDFRPDALLELMVEKHTVALLPAGVAPPGSEPCPYDLAVYGVTGEGFVGRRLDDNGDATGEEILVPWADFTTIHIY